MSLIDKLEDLVVKVDTEYQEKMEAEMRKCLDKIFDLAIDERLK